MRKLIFGLCLMMGLVSWGRDLAVSPQDSEMLSAILTDLKQSDAGFGEKLVMAARAMEGAVKDNYYTNDSIAALRINIDSVTPLMFVNNAIAMVKTSELPGNVSISAFGNELENISCRRGENTGYPSIMYHSSDWIGDNMARGNITELTENYNGVIARTKSLDEMTRKRKDYAALADSATFETVRMIEMGFRTHRVPTLKKEIAKKKELIGDLQNGDIIILVPSGDGIDYYDIGFVSIMDDGPHLIHLSPHSKTVVEEKEILPRYLDLMTKYFQGFRILRVKE